MSLPNLHDYHIGIDLDHTTYNPLPAICQAINNQYGTALSPHDITAYDHPIPGTSDTIAKVIHELHGNKEFIQNMALMPGAADAIRALDTAGATISIITHRNPNTFDWTQQSLTENNIPYDTFVEDVPQNKADVDTIDILIDDLQPQVEGMALTDRDGILFLRPYNIDTIPQYDGVHTALRNGHTTQELIENPARQWAEIQTIITDIAETNSEHPSP